jgi:fatty-acyl-CoA synthase
METFFDILQGVYEDQPEKIAIYMLHTGQQDRSITYRELLQGAAAYQAKLSENEILPGEVVILILEHGADLIYAFFGSVLHGAIPSIMPFLTEKLLPERYRSDLAKLISITQPAAIITYSEFEDEIRGALVKGDSVRAVMLSDCIEPITNPEINIMPGVNSISEDIVLLQHSSGTTGLQKGVALSHKAVINQLDSYAQSLSLDRNDVIVSWLPLYHDMGLIAGFLMPILLKVPLILMSPFDWIRAPYRLMQAVSKYHGTLSWLPNFAYNLCAKKVRDRHLEGIDLSSWRGVINCSEPMRWDSHQVFLQKYKPYGLREDALGTCYAMAENVFAVTQGGMGSPIMDDDIDLEAFQKQRLAIPSKIKKSSTKMLSAGTTIRNVDICVLGDGGEDLPDRHVGEIAIRSNCMLTEYYRRPEETEKAFDQGWFKTGDYGYIVDKELFVTGRKKDLIIVGGKNIYPQDIETLVNEVPGIHAGRVVAFGIYDETVGTEEVVIIAEVETKDDQQKRIISDNVRQNVTQGSAIALRTVYLTGANWLIKTSSGKIARSANRDKYLVEIS